MTEPIVGFVGLGAMGEPMARRVAEAGFPLVLLDANVDKANGLAGQTGGTVAANGKAMAAECDIIITMLPSSAIVRSVLDGDAGLAAGLKPGSVLLEMSSGVPGDTRIIATELEAKGIHVIDAPVSGGVSRAKTGDLAIMAGGGDEGFELCEKVLASMGSSIIRTGPVGSAHAMKALNNLVSAGGFLIGVEALLIGTRFGLDPELMVDVLNVSTGMNNSTQKKFKQFVLSRSFNAGFGLDLMVKDLGVAMGVAETTGTDAPFASLCRDLWRDAQQKLGSGQDHTDMARYSEMLAGSELKKGAK